MSATGDQTPDIPAYDKLLAETARVSWAEIERLFAAGKVVEVAASLDLIEVAAAFAQDDKDQVRQWMQAEQVGLLSDESAAMWAGLDEAALWAVVVNPWVLVQHRP